MQFFSIKKILAWTKPGMLLVIEHQKGFSLDTDQRAGARTGARAGGLVV